MTFSGPQPPVGSRGGFARAWIWWLAAAVAVTAVAAVAVVAVSVSLRAAHHRALRVGDCVVLDSSTGGELHATRSACGTDPSFTVAKLADAPGDCAPNDYDRFGPPAADSATGRLCLVPNLVADHCYRIGVAVGVWNLVDCADAGPAVIKVTKRLDVDDAQACRPDGQLPARSYPAPPRTYCLGLAA